tara:strand:+ start:4585 stop:5280 length:696 start_codon:yes stop_codon:yes gene_type:complete
VYKNIIKNLKNNFPKFLSIYYKFRFVFRAIYLKEPRAHLLWILKRGDHRYFKNFNLDSNSVFFDVGGFEGDYTDKILKEYNCTSYIFEPHPVYFEALQKKFANNNKVKIFNYGIGGKSEDLFLTDDSASSKVTNKKTGLKIVVKDIVEVLGELGIKKIDFLKLNIEGMEYSLLERLIDTGEINKIDKMKIQFHENVSNAESWREDIRENLKNTHKEIWSYYFVWERWDKIE